jgi:hypothetical protein
MSNEIIQSVAYDDNYDDFRHVNFTFSQSFISLFSGLFNDETDLRVSKGIWWEKVESLISFQTHQNEDHVWGKRSKIRKPMWCKLVATWERYFGPKFRLTSGARECGWRGAGGVGGGGPQEILAIHLVSSGAHTWSASKACLFVCYWLER